VLKIDPANGDLVQYIAKTTDDAAMEHFRRHAHLDGTGTVVQYILETRRTFGLVHTHFEEGFYNAAAAAKEPTVVITAARGNGVIRVRGYNNGIGEHIRSVPYWSDGSTLVLATTAAQGVQDFAPSGAVFTIAAAGSSFEVTPGSSGTNLHITYDSYVDGA
jgi:hypothetical protein